MITAEKDIFINTPPQEVFDFFTNPSNIPQWRSESESVEWTSEGPPGVGSTLREVGKFMGRRIESTTEIIAWDPPNEYGRKSTSGPIPFEIRVKLEPKENGTQLKAHGQGEFRGLFKIAEGLASKQAQKQMDAEFEALKLILEAGKA